jgi:hypothetical protein
MSVERSLLPPLPGKPEWYVENAPMAIDTTDSRDPRVTTPGNPVVPAQALEGMPTLLPAESPLAARAFPTAGQASHGGGLGRVKALAGRLRH